MTPRVIAVLDDLFFAVKIADAAKRSGLEFISVKTGDALFERLKQGSSIVILDLNCKSVDPVALASSVKQQFASTPVIGFVSHVQVDLRVSAEQAGCDLVLPRSVFSSKLPEVLRQFCGQTP